MSHRRADDPLTSQMLHLRVGVPEEGSAPRVTFREIHAGNGAGRSLDAVEAYAALADHQDRLILVETGQTQDVWLMLGSVVGRIPDITGDDPRLAEKAEREAIIWRRTNLARWKRLELPTNLIGFTQALVSADSPDSVCTALGEATVRIFGAHRAVVLRREDDGRSFRLVTCSGSEPMVDTGPVPDHPLFAEPGILLPTDPRLDASASLAGLRPLFDSLNPEALYHSPVGEQHLLMISERRAGRRVAMEEWQILRLLTAQAEGALRRIALFEAVHNLSLTDELTGLANRRHMKLVLSHALAAARRGVPLTLVLIDVDDFKQINDREGHLAGDRVLRRLAQCLQTQGRGSDLVVRFGGDEFVVVLPGGDLHGAESFMRRVRARLDAGITVSFGIAEYDPATTSTVEQLIEAADTQLYASKRTRGVLHDPPQA